MDEDSKGYMNKIILELGFKREVIVSFVAQSLSQLLTSQSFVPQEKLKCDATNVETPTLCMHIIRVTTFALGVFLFVCLAFIFI